MSINSLHDKVKFGKYKYLGSRYYDHPDGQDLLGKLEFTTKVSGFVGIFGGVVNASLPPMPPTVGGKFFRVMQIAVPMVGMAATFTFVTYSSTVIRKKDDQLNYAIGSLAAGSLLAPMGKGFAVICSLVFTAIGVMKKTVEMEGKKVIMPVTRRGFSSYYQRKLNTSFTEERKGNWTKELPAN